MSPVNITPMLKTAIGVVGHPLTVPCQSAHQSRGCVPESEALLDYPQVSWEGYRENHYG